MNSLLLTILVAHSAPVHIHVDGEGYFRFARGAQAVYAADAFLAVQNGLVCNGDGLPLLPQTRLPVGASFSVQMDGSILSAGRSVSRIVLADFPQGALRKLGKYWIANTRSQIGFPGEGVLGIIRNASGSSSAAPIRSATTETGNTATVEVSLKSEIGGPEILLGDVATIQGPKELSEQISNVDLGPTPIFNAQRGITRSYVSAAMRHAGIDIEKVTLLVPSGSFAIRKGQKVDSEMMISAAKDGLKQQLGASEDVRSDRLISEFYVPAGQLSFNTVQAIPAGDGYTVNLEVDVDGKMVTRRTIGLLPLNPAAKVQAGEPVKIRVTKNGACVEVDGKTRVSGKVGSTISVLSDAGATFTGTLVTTSLVEVKL